MVLIVSIISMKILYFVLIITKPNHLTANVKKASLEKDVSISSLVIVKKWAMFDSIQTTKMYQFVIFGHRLKYRITSLINFIVVSEENPLEIVESRHLKCLISTSDSRLISVCEKLESAVGKIEEKLSNFPIFPTTRMPLFLMTGHKL